MRPLARRCRWLTTASVDWGLVAYRLGMALSERTKSLLGALFAISPILRRFALPGLVGLLLFAAGAWQALDWLKVVGIILAVPVIWAYAVLLLVYFPFLLFDSMRRSLKKTR